MARATPGSAGLDLPSSVHAILTPDSEVTLIPTGVYGPLPQGYFGLILGRSSLSSQGIFILPGIIDSDFQGEIKVMIQPPVKTVQIRPQQRIAQILIIPYLNNPNAVLKSNRGDQGFGSSNVVAWIQKIKQSRPMKYISVEGLQIKGILDTGADVSCIAGKDWPPSWPTSKSPSTLIGLGLASNVAKSTQILHWQCEEKTGTFQPYVIPSLPFTLWGRDILQQFNVVLTNDIPQISKQPFS